MALTDGGPHDLTKLVQETLEKHGLDPRAGYEMIHIAMSVHPDERMQAVLAVLEEEGSRV